MSATGWIAGMPPTIAVGPRGDGPFSARPYTDQDAMNTLVAHGGMGCLLASPGIDMGPWRLSAQNVREPPPELGITWTRTGGRTWRVVVTR